jgi:hypothetical protein
MEACAEPAADSQLALDLSVPAGKTLGIGESRPQLVDPGVEAVLDANDARAVGGLQAAQGAIGSTCMARHLLLLRFAGDRSALVTDPAGPRESSVGVTRDSALVPAGGEAM